MAEQNQQPEPARALLLAPDEVPSRKTVRYGSGRVLTLLDSPGDERLTIRSPSGRVELQVRFTPEGPLLEFDSDAITLRNSGALELECERFAVRAKHGVDIRSEAEVCVRGEGDVSIDGQNLKLNCEPRGRELVPRE